MIAGVLCVCLSFVSCNRVICILLVCMKCVNCSILFLIPSVLGCNMFMLCVLVFVLLLGEGCGGLFGGGAVVVGPDVPALAVCMVSD